jgi:CRP-like cAMP-binding protein
MAGKDRRPAGLPGVDRAATFVVNVVLVTPFSFFVCLKFSYNRSTAAAGAARSRSQEEPVASPKAQISENVQKFIARGDWKNALAEMEKLFAIDQDPQVKVRMGDIRQKMNQKQQAVAEYMQAAAVFADRGFVVKALAMYKLVLRLDPNNDRALDLMAQLHSNRTVAEAKFEPVAAGDEAPTNSVIPLFADLTREEFTELTNRMVFHTEPAGKVIVREGDTGASVYVITRGGVRVHTKIDGRQMELAQLQPSDFFGEIAFLTGQPRTATVETTVESDILEVPEGKLKELIGQKPRIREVLQRYYEQRVASTLKKVKGLP